VENGNCVTLPCGGQGRQEGRETLTAVSTGYPVLATKAGLSLTTALRGAYSYPHSPEEKAEIQRKNPSRGPQMANSRDVFEPRLDV